MCRQRSKEEWFSEVRKTLSIPSGGSVQVCNSLNNVLEVQNVVHGLSECGLEIASVVNLSLSSEPIPI